MDTRTGETLSHEAMEKLGEFMKKMESSSQFRKEVYDRIRPMSVDPTERTACKGAADGEGTRALSVRFRQAFSFTSVRNSCPVSRSLTARSVQRHVW